MVSYLKLKLVPLFKYKSKTIDPNPHPKLNIYMSTKHLRLYTKVLSSNNMKNITNLLPYLSSSPKMFEVLGILKG